MTKRTVLYQEGRLVIFFMPSCDDLCPNTFRGLLSTLAARGYHKCTRLLLRLGHKIPSNKPIIMLVLNDKKNNIIGNLHHVALGELLCRFQIENDRLILQRH